MKVARAIEEALGKPEILNQVSQRAIQQRKDFSWETAENAWDKIITAALNSRSDTS
jgi:glycosyltransferase involved in cell wall biosynthesis